MRRPERIATRLASALVIVALAIALPIDRADARSRPARSSPRCGGNAVPGSSVRTADRVGDTIVDTPEIATGFASKDVATARTVMAVTANPIASRVACDILVRGGNAIDAAVAAQMVLNLVEPQSSGVGGGAFLLYYDAKRRTVSSYDGRETAPAAATENYLRWVDDAGDRTTPRPTTRSSGRSIGVPGVVAMLALAHREQGRLPWRTLFDPAIAIATNGFRIGPRMSESIESARAGLARDADAAAYFLDGDGYAKKAGTLLKSPVLATTFATIARQGPSAFYSGDLARAIVARVADTGTTSDATTPGRMTMDDLARYRAKRRDPVCSPYRAYVVCSVGPPSSGGIAVEATLGILEPFDLGALKPDPVDRDGGHPDAEAVHLVAEAERLAYADRDKYVADADFVPLPGGSPARMLDRAYLRSRARLIDPARSMGRAQAGDLGPVPLGVDTTEEHGTTHLVIADADGDVVSMTTTVESGFGSFHFVRGFLLNNQLTDFASNPVDANGTSVANRVAGGKRPRSAMAPTLVFQRDVDAGPGRDERGDFVLATGSAGGFVIIQYVVKTLIGVLDWGLDAQQAVSLIDFGAGNSPTTYVGGEHPDVDRSEDGAHDPLVGALRAKGHTVSVAPHSSGLTMLMRTTVAGKPGWSGGADPRREGVAIGDGMGR